MNGRNNGVSPRELEAYGRLVRGGALYMVTAQFYIYFANWARDQGYILRHDGGGAYHSADGTAYKWVQTPGDVRQYARTAAGLIVVPTPSAYRVRSGGVEIGRLLAQARALKVRIQNTKDTHR